MARYPGPDPGPFNVRFRGREWWPAPGFEFAPAADRDWYWSVLGDIAVGELHSQMRRGIGADGAPLPGVRPSSRPDGATGRPLVPHFAESRTWRNLASATGARGVTVYWTGGWGKVLAYHARQGGTFVRGAPLRDVRPSVATLRRVRSRARTAWLSRLAARLAPTPSPIASRPMRDVAPVPVPPVAALPAVVELPPGVPATSRRLRTFDRPIF